MKNLFFEENLPDFDAVVVCKLADFVVVTTVVVIEAAVVDVAEYFNKSHFRIKTA